MIAAACSLEVIFVQTIFQARWWPTSDTRPAPAAQRTLNSARVCLHEGRGSCCGNNEVWRTDVCMLPDGVARCEGLCVKCTSD